MKYIEWHITNDCNLFCSHCMMNSIRNSKKLTAIDEKIILNRVLDLKPDIINVTGGEPLLSGNVFEIGKKIHEKGIIATLSTNGTVPLSHQLLTKIIEYYNGGVQVSIDSPIEQIHDQIRGKKGSFKKSIEFIRRIKKISKDYSVQICMCIRQDNYNSIDGYLDFAKKNNIREVKLLQLMHLGRGKKLKNIDETVLKPIIENTIKKYPDIRVVYSKPPSTLLDYISNGIMIPQMIDIDAEGNIRISQYINKIIGNILFMDSREDILQQLTNNLQNIKSKDVLV